MPAKGQFKNRRYLTCPCGKEFSIRASNVERKYCSFSCYRKYTKGYDHKALGFRHDERTKNLISDLAKSRPVTDVQIEAYKRREASHSQEYREERNRRIRATAPSGPMPMKVRNKVSLSRIGKGYGGSWNYRGGYIGDMFADILCPVGYVREFVWVWGPLGIDRFHLDFGHPEAKVCFELDGPGHTHTAKEDAQRDEILRHFGWKVIRIKHD